MISIVTSPLNEVASVTTSKSKQAWTLADAQANLAEVLRRAETEGPQYIEAAGTFVVTPVEPVASQDEERMPLGQWLIENVPQGTNLVIPDDDYPDDEIPWTEEVYE